MEFRLDMLPPKSESGLIELETVKVMRVLSKAHRSLAELKGYSEIVPNKNILIKCNHA